jgi:hypothetical protein
MDGDTRQQAGSVGHDMALTTFGVTSPSSLILRASDFRADVVLRKMCHGTGRSDVRTTSGENKLRLVAG